jgi:hypothetical protein
MRDTGSTSTPHLAALPGAAASSFAYYAYFSSIRRADA